jgi:hypothetical protein
MAEEDFAMGEDELERIAANLERGLYGPWEMRRLILACRTQRRVLRHIFDLFVIDEHGVRANAHSVRADNLAALKKEVDLE